jgi:hypothetical protein
LTSILPQVEELISALKQLMPTLYQQETLESILGLFLSGQGNALPHHCQTKSESAISRFLNHYKQLLIPWLNEQGFDFCLMRCKI